MKIADGFVLSKMRDTAIVIPVGSKTINFKSVISLNETGEFLWKQLSTDKTEQELVLALMKEYETDEETAKGDVIAFINTLKNKNLLEL